MIEMKHIYWLAGFYEGEGSVACYRKNGGYFALSITQKDTEVLYKLQLLFGGKVYDIGKYDSSREYSCWMAYGQRAVGLAMTIFTLMTKRRQAQLLAALMVWRSVPTRKQASKTSEARRNPITGRYGPSLVKGDYLGQ